MLNYDVSRCGFLVFILFGIRSFLDLWIPIFQQIWKRLAIVSSNIFFSVPFCLLFSGTLITDTLDCLILLPLCFFVFFFS